jgi:hypothetical protein
MNIWKTISNLGTEPDMDFRLSRRIILSNQFAFLIALLTIVFMVAFSTRANVNFLPFIVILAVACFIWISNAVGLTRLSRLITCLTPALGLLFMNMSLKFNDSVKVDILHYATPRMLILGSVILPFTVFTPFEKRYMWTGIALILGVAFGYDAIHSLMGVDHQSLGLTNDFYGVIYEDMIVLTVMIVSAAGFMFNLGNQYDFRTQRLLSEAIEQTHQLKKKEEEMGKTLDELEVSRKKDEERNWVAKGINEMITILQSGDDSAKIFDKVLSTLVKYAGMNQGALYVAQTDEEGHESIKLVSCYAYERKKFVERTIEPGTGLIGQAYLEGERTYLRDIPAEFVRITSGLGEATPRHLVIIPMKVNKKVEGIFELASFSNLEQRHFDLFDRLAETLASFISNSRVNESTKMLLQKAQVMSEELKANEEEMRQNMEELTATQEAMTRKEREYQDRIIELEKALEKNKAFA